MIKKTLKNTIIIAAIMGMLSTNMVAFAADNYTVVKNDSLKKISKQVYGDESQWETIYNANKEKIKNPNLIYDVTPIS